MEFPVRLRCENITDEIVQKYQEDGYRLVFQEYVMEHDLRNIPELEISPSVVLKSWSPELKGTSTQPIMHLSRIVLDFQGGPWKNG